MKKFITLLACIALCISTACQRVSYPILTPSVSISEYAASNDKICDCIIYALAKRGWTVEKTSEGYIQASIIVRNKHGATIGINYSSSSVTINYVSSYNLDFKDKGDDGKFIHQKYNLWVRFLASDIKKLIKKNVSIVNEVKL